MFSEVVRKLKRMQRQIGDFHPIGTNIIRLALVPIQEHHVALLG